MPAPNRLIPDALLRELIAAGRVDLLVGVATRNHADTIGSLVAAALGSFLTYFPRERAVLLNVDLGSTDGTPDVVRQAPAEPGAGARPAGLRTTHRITTPAPATAGPGGAMNLIFAAAELLQARALVLLDADLAAVAPERVAALAAPVLRDAVDLVTPVYTRPPGDGLLVTQLLRPLMSAVYGWRLEEPFLSELGASGRFAAHGRAQPGWSADVIREQPGGWLTGEAFAAGFTVRQTELGARRFLPNRPAPGLTDVFRQAVGTTFCAIAEHEAYWRTRDGCELVPTIPRASAGPPDPDEDRWPDADRVPDSFADDVRNLREILRSVLGDALEARLTAAAGGSARPRYPDDLWAETVTGALLAFHRGVMRRDHVIQALHPLYTARARSFLEEHEHGTPQQLDAAGATLCARFARLKPQLVDGWHAPAPR